MCRKLLKASIPPDTPAVLLDQANKLCLDPPGGLRQHGYFHFGLKQQFEDLMKLREVPEGDRGGVPPTPSRITPAAISYPRSVFGIKQQSTSDLLLAVPLT